MKAAWIYAHIYTCTTIMINDHDHSLNIYEARLSLKLIKVKPKFTMMECMWNNLKLFQPYWRVIMNLTYLQKNHLLPLKTPLVNLT